jgi:hypothetical protein
MVLWSNRCTDFDENWDGHYATRDDHVFILTNYLLSIIET